MLSPPLRSTLFPYTTLFRSSGARIDVCYDGWRVRAVILIQLDAFTIIGVGAKVQRHRRSEEHTSELQSLRHLVCRLLLEKKKNYNRIFSIDVMRTIRKDSNH